MNEFAIEWTKGGKRLMIAQENVGRKRKVNKMFSNKGESHNEHHS